MLGNRPIASAPLVSGRGGAEAADLAASLSGSGSLSGYLVGAPPVVIVPGGSRGLFRNIKPDKPPTEIVDFRARIYGASYVSAEIGSIQTVSVQIAASSDFSGAVSASWAAYDARFWLLVA